VPPGALSSDRVTPSSETVSHTCSASNEQQGEGRHQQAEATCQQQHVDGSWVPGPTLCKTVFSCSPVSAASSSRLMEACRRIGGNTHFGCQQPDLASKPRWNVLAKAQLCRNATSAAETKQP
jgi:hypothetical protein